MAQDSKTDNPFEVNKKVPMAWFTVFDDQDRGYYFIEDQPVTSQEEADGLFKKYGKIEN